MKTTKYLICLLLIIITLSSCSKDEKYIVDYPDIYTIEYCNDNYIPADPNLMCLRAADNDIGRINVPGGYAHYCAIKDVPLEDYLFLDESIMFTYSQYKILKNKNNSNLPTQEILSYKIKSVMIYWSSIPPTENIDDRRLGTNMVDECLYSFFGNDAIAFQSHIIECINTGNYKKTGLAGDFVCPIQGDRPGTGLNLKVEFDECEGLFWGTAIYKQDNNYYILFHMKSDEQVDGWDQYWLPLYQEIVELITNITI